MSKNPGNCALARIKKLFPSVKSVSDAKRSLVVAVTKADVAHADKKDPSGCALAVACKRMRHADAALIGLSYSYIIKGAKAVRFKTSVAVSREITSFDRHGDFSPGDFYVLSKISPSVKLGSYRAKPHSGTRPPHKSNSNGPYHRTENIRASAI